MNLCQIISASTVGRCSYFGQDRPIIPIVSVEDHGFVHEYTNTTAHNRFSRPITLYPSQSDFIKRIVNPFRISSVTCNLRNRRGILEEVTCRLTRSFPCARIVNLPTGVGKTIITTLGALEASVVYREAFAESFATFLKSFEFHTARGTIGSTLKSTRHILLPNVIFVFAPKHLVGQWIDTFNVNAGENVRVNTSFNLLQTDFNILDIQSNPDKTFVFVLHPGNHKKVIEAYGNEVVAGVAIFDEADSTSFPCSEFHTQIPVAMYTLMVTATPGNILNVFTSSRQASTTNLVAHYFSHPFFPSGFDIYSYGDERKLHECLSDVVAMQLALPFGQYDTDIVREVSSTIPDLHSYTVRTRVALARAFGTAANDLENPRAALERIEADLEIRIYGQTIADMRAQIQEHIDMLVAIPNKARNLEVRLERLRSTLRRVQEIDGFCGICLEDFTSESSSLRLTSCCGFFICPSCHGQIRSCAKCRNPNVRYIDLVSAPKPASKDKKSKSKSKKANEEGEGGEEQKQDSLLVSPMKDVAGFESFVQSFNFSSVDQVSALNIITENAMKFGLTHLIFAGGGVDSWPGFGKEADSFFAYDIVRPVGYNNSDMMKKTAKRLDAAYRKFCAGTNPSVLLLDSRTNDSVELTGIDAGVTDLIVQVGTDAGGYAYTQLAGRAMRFGRSQTNPVRIILN